MKINYTIITYIVITILLHLSYSNLVYAASMDEQGNLILPLTPSVVVAGGGNTERTLANHFSDIINVKDFGAKCDGATDDTSAFQNAYTFLNSIGGGKLVLPWNGNCHIKGPITATTPIVVEGAGKYNSIITQETVSSDTLVWSGSYFGGGVYNLSIFYENHSGMSAGSGIYINGVSDFFAKNVNIEYPYDGVREDAAGVIRLENVDISRATHDSFLINGGPVQYLTNVSAYNDDDSPSNAGIEIVATGATHLVNSGMSGQGSSVMIDPSGAITQHSGWSEGQAFDIWISGCDLDDAYSSGLSVIPSSGNIVYNVQVIDTRIGVSRGTGVSLGSSGSNGTINDIVFSGDMIAGSKQQGVLILSGTNISFDGTQVLGSSVQGGSYSGIDLEGGGVIIMNGVTSGKWKDLKATQAYGLEIGSYFSGNLSFVGGNLSDNISGPYVNYSNRSPHISISHTTPVNPVGIKLPTVGASPWTYTAGPTQETFIVSGGQITSLVIDGVTMPFQTNMAIPMNPGQSITMTYTEVPNIVVNGQ